MRLKKIQVTNYKNVDDSSEFSVNDVTCLVGKNEAGKTAILRALYKLNPCEPQDKNYDKQNEYPRRYLSDFEERHPEGDATVIQSKWELSESEIAKLKEVLGVDSVTGREIVVSKGYSGSTTWDVSVDEKKTFDHILIKSGLHDEEKEVLKDAGTVKDLKAHLDKLGAAMSDRHKVLLGHITEHFKRGSAAQAAIDMLNPLMPKFLYFSNYDRMSGQVSLEHLKAKNDRKESITDNEKVFMAFLGLVGVTLEDLISQNKFEPLISRLEAVSIKITREIFEYWTQNRHLKVEFRLDAGRTGDPAPFNSGNVMRTRILNTQHDVTVPFDERSTGFVWFFSFLVFFSQIKKSFGNNLIILLDEPGLSLHAKAQWDLLRYFNEKIRPHHQLFYTTHSPFMVPSDDILSVRTVEDVVKIDKDGKIHVSGTKVGEDVLSTDKETLFPLQGALGYEITQSLFVGEHTLLVEGPSDFLYLKVMSDELRSLKRVALDPRWTICPAGGVDKVGAFMSLFGGNRLHIAVLIDYAKGQKKKVEEMKKSSLLKKGHVLTAETYAGKDEADIEDILGRTNYVELVNRTYELSAKNAIDAKKLEKENHRITSLVETHFKTLPQDVPEYDHYRPSAFLLQNRTEVMKNLPDLDSALDRFELLFKDLNTLI